MEPVILNQRYRLLELIGTGGMATVYRGHDQRLDRLVAVKVLREPYASDPAFRDRFLAEARAAARLDHPNIIRAYDVGEHDHQPYIIMELVEGKDLKKLILNQGPLPIPQALDLGKQICAGVGYAHKNNLVHCDLKPQNILITPSGQVKIADFGIARAFQAEETPQPEEQVVWGSPHYIAPEQAAGHAPTPASDVYSIGIILYEMLTGVPPFHSEDPNELVNKQLNEAPQPMVSLNPRVPPRLDSLVLKILSKEPSNRYRNADQLYIVLEAYQRQGEESTIPHPVAQGRSTPPPPAPVPVPLTPPVEPEKIPTPPIREEPTRESSEPMTWILLAVAIIAVIGLIPLWGTVISRMYPNKPSTNPITTPATATPQPGQMVNVPNLIGLSAPQAQRLAEGMGLVLTVTGEKENNESLPGSVLEQDPRPGARTPVNSTINVILAAGRTFTMPQVTEYSLDMIRPQLETQGLLVTVDETWSAAPAGRIVNQNPPANTLIRAGTTITLTVSGGLEYPLSLQVNLNNLILLQDALMPQATFRPGDSIPVTLRAKASQQIPERYTIFVHLFNGAGELIAQQDSEPVNGMRSTDSWQPGELIVDPHQIKIPEGTPAGTYQIRVGFYNAAGRLPVVDPGRASVTDNSILVTQVTIQP